MSHTPGPWEWDEISDDGSVIRVGGGHIASVMSPDDFPCLNEEEMAEEIDGLWVEHRANCRLIAASPDLLEACEVQHKAIYVLLVMLIECDSWFMPSQSPAWDALVKGNAAIKKAKGGTQ